MKSSSGLPPSESCLSCKQRSDEFFCNLSQESLKVLDQMKHVTHLPARAVIFSEGQSPRGIYMLCQGQAKLSVSSRGGKTFILRIAEPGEILGLHSVVASRPYELTAETMQPCQLNFVSQQDFLRFLKDHGEACVRAAQHISRDCQDAYDVVRTIGLSTSASGKVAKFLLTSATDGRVKDGVIHTKLALTHDDIGQLTGTSRETITRTLGEFRKKNIVELKGSVLIIHDKSALEQLVAT